MNGIRTLLLEKMQQKSLASLPLSLIGWFENTVMQQTCHQKAKPEPIDILTVERDDQFLRKLLDLIYVDSHYHETSNVYF